MGGKYNITKWGGGATGCVCFFLLLSGLGGRKGGTRVLEGGSSQDLMLTALFILTSVPPYRKSILLWKSSSQIRISFNIFKAADIPIDSRMKVSNEEMF